MSVVAQPTGNSAIVYLDSIVGKNYANDAAAAAAGIGIGGLYHSSGYLRVRIGSGTTPGDYATTTTSSTTTTTTTRAGGGDGLEEPAER